MRIGPTIVAIAAFGVQPFSMKNAVIMPQAMMAAMLGMIMPDMNAPNFCTETLADLGCAATSVVI